MPCQDDGETGTPINPETLNRTAETIRAWATERQIQRFRADRRVGLPEKEQLANWAAILHNLGIVDSREVFAVLDRARFAAERLGGWRNWTYLTLQVQLAAERFHPNRNSPPVEARLPDSQEKEDPGGDWAAAKAMIRTQIPETAFTNWFAPSRQLERRQSILTVAVQDEPTRRYLTVEYAHLIEKVVSNLGINEVRFLLQDLSYGDTNERTQVGSSLSEVLHWGGQ